MNGSDLPRAMPYRWRDEAACTGMDPDIFHPEDRYRARPNYNNLELRRIAAARAVCARCPVGDECEAEGEAIGDRLSIRNGKTAQERNPTIRHLYGDPADQEHGTPAGYRKHYRLGTKPCPSCREAHAASRPSRMGVR